jgi:hypothetical protein
MANGTIETIVRMLKELGWTNEAIYNYCLYTFGVVIESK